MNVVAVVGNPKPASRTRGAAELVAERLTGAPPHVQGDLLESSWDASPELDGWIERARDVLRPPGG